MIEKILICGTKSGRECDKFAIYKFTKLLAQFVRAPLIGECIANIECKVVDEVEVGDHTFFVGEIVNVSYGDAFKEKPDVKNYKFIMHLSGRDFTTNSSEVYNP